MKNENLPEDITPTAALTKKFDTTKLFDASVTHPTLSPIDQYIENTNRLSRMYLNDPVRSAYTNDLGIIFLLGHVSAVESYLRGLIRGLVKSDEHVKKLVGPLPVTYIAALYHEKDLLPEALLEGVSFSSASNISKVLKEYCGITGFGNGTYPNELKPVFEEFSAICQLRHCCVHRFGLLGADNARSLGIETHSEFLEKPLTLSLDSLEDISLILQTFVSSLNSYLYRDVLQRTVLNSPVLPPAPQRPMKYASTWKFDFVEDENRFTSLHDLFARTKVAPISPSVNAQYVVFCKWAKEYIADDTRERAFKSQKRPTNLTPQVISTPTESTVSPPAP